MRTIPIANPILDTASCRHGHFLFPARDQYVGASLREYGEYCEAELEAMHDALQHQAWFQRQPVVIEVGANIGAHTLAFAEWAETVIAFEPQGFICDVLRANLLLNGVENVQVLRAAVSATPFPRTAYLPKFDYSLDNNYGGVEIGTQCEIYSDPVNEVRLDDVISTEHVDLIKIDAEGSDLDVLLGAQDLITHFRPVVFVEDDRLGQRAEIHAFLKNRDYHLTRVDCPLYTLSNFRSNPINIFGPVVSSNVLAVPCEKVEG